MATHCVDALAALANDGNTNGKHRVVDWLFFFPILFWFSSSQLYSSFWGVLGGDNYVMMKSELSTQNTQRDRKIKEE